MKKLKKILLINWLYFSKELIEVGDINFLTGKNGAGKSTVIDALQIVLLGETNARNFNQAANEKSQRTLEGYLRADMDDNSPYSRRGKDFSTYIVCEFQDEMEGSSFVTGVTFDCRSDGSYRDTFFIYTGTLPENCFIEQGEAMETSALRRFLKQNYARAEFYDTQKEYRRNMLAKWNVHNEQVLRMMKKAVSFRPIVDIQKFITENICDRNEKILVIADGAAFGPEMDRVLQLVLTRENLALYLPESFEWLVLSSGILKDTEVAQILQTPSGYIDSKEYFSWERYFTALLIEKSAGTYLNYTKKTLNKAYLSDSTKNAILGQMMKGKPE